MKKYEVLVGLSGQEVTDLINSGKELVAVTKTKDGYMEHHFVSEIYASLQSLPKTKTLQLSDEKLHQLLACLNNACYVVDEDDVLENNNYDELEKNRLTLIQMNTKLLWDIAEHFNYDMNDGGVNPQTLKYFKY